MDIWMDGFLTMVLCDESSYHLSHYGSVKAFGGLALGVMLHHSWFVGEWGNSVK